MPEYEGLVSSLTADDKAEVVIRPGMPGIPGAPEVSARVCHAPTDGSAVRVEALNTARAHVGDWVSITRQSGMLMKNAAVLLGIPVLGGVSGLVAGAIFSHGFAVNVSGAVVFAAMGLLLGIVISSSTYRRMSASNQPIISRVIKTRTEVASLLNGNQSCSKNEDVGCNRCLLNLP